MHDACLDHLARIRFAAAVGISRFRRGRLCVGVLFGSCDAGAFDRCFSDDYISDSVADDFDRLGDRLLWSADSDRDLVPRFRQVDAKV